MCPLAIHNSDGQSIHSVEDWFKYAPPKEREKHWVCGRSAKELAKAWFRTGEAKVPQELEMLLKSYSGTQDLIMEEVIPEKKIKLDEFGGEPRNGDLVLTGKAKEARVVVGIEAKADEPFGPIIQDYLNEKKDTRSKVPDRIKLLLLSIFRRAVDEKLGKLRYQLLHGLAGTLIEAKDQKASLALFVVHEFISNKVDAERVRQNALDFENFVKAFPGHEKDIISPGKLVGPIKVPGGQYVPKDFSFLIGKVVTHLSE